MLGRADQAEVRGQRRMKTLRQIGVLLFEQVTLLDVIGPFEILARLPDTTASLVSKCTVPLKTDLGITITPQLSYENCPSFDVILVPGGPGQQALMDDSTTLSFLRNQAASAAYIASVCTGSLILGAAGLLQGYRATSHWTVLDVLRELGAIPQRERVVIDRNRITGAGVSAGIDMALQLAALLESEECAQELQLLIEYSPAPLFNCGSPELAPQELVARVRANKQDLINERMASARKAKEHFQQWECSQT